MALIPSAARCRITVSEMSSDERAIVNVCRKCSDKISLRSSGIPDRSASAMPIPFLSAGRVHLPQPLFCGIVQYNGLSWLRREGLEPAVESCVRDHSHRRAEGVMRSRCISVAFSVFVAAFVAVACCAQPALAGSTGSLTGTVVNATGAPVAGARVTAGDPAGSYRTTAD